MIFLYTDYRKYLQDILLQRKQRNKAYSLRAFAKALNVPASTFSEVLSGRKALTGAAVKKVVSGLRLRKDQARFFELLVEKSLTKSISRKKVIDREIEILVSFSQRKLVPPDQNDLLNRGIEFVFIELGGIDGFELTTARAAKAVGITENEALSTLEKLVQVGAMEITKGGHYAKIGTGVMVASQQVNFNLRQFHTSMLEQAKKSLSEQTPQERYVGSETFSFHSSQLQEANDLIEDFFSNLVALANRHEKKDSVYHLGVQMFRLTQKGAVQ